MLEMVLRKGTLLHCCWKGKLVQPLWKTVWRFIRKVKTKLPYDSVIPLLGIYLDKVKWSEVKLLSRVQPFAAPLIVAHQVSLSVEFSRQEYWGELSFPSPGDFPDPGLNPFLLHLLHRQANSLPLCYLGSPFSVHRAHHSLLQQCCVCRYGKRYR